jgi:hypothetical protein
MEKVSEQDAFGENRNPKEIPISKPNAWQGKRI